MGCWSELPLSSGLLVQAASPDFKNYMEQVVTNCAHFAKVRPLQALTGVTWLPRRLPLVRFLGWGMLALEGPQVLAGASWQSYGV